MTPAEDTALRQDYVEMLGANEPESGQYSVSDEYTDPATQPLARLIPLSVPEESEAEFYHRRYCEIAKELAAERAKNQRLTLGILELLEEEAEA